MFIPDACLSLGSIVVVDHGHRDSFCGEIEAIDGDECTVRGNGVFRTVRFGRVSAAGARTWVGNVLDLAVAIANR